ncbi:MAG: WYL domain-containing protein, partial [Myxococcales bacterium]|nr:WYL domain-containing protein [Myxococcales bacterium]
LAPFEDGPLDVCWGFDADAADDVAVYDFHSDQQVERRVDGSIAVRFQADGIVEMAWHLFGFGDRIRLLETPILKSRFDTMMRRALDARARVLEQKDAFVSLDG